MEKMLEEIIDIFASTKISKIRPGVLKGIEKKYCPEETSIYFDTQFSEYINLVSEYKEYIEKVEKDYDDPKAQAKECLVYLRKIRIEKSNAKMEVFETLVKKCFFDKKWHKLPEIIKFFDDSLPLVKDRWDFFFSYTNRNAKVTNLDFRKCLPDIEYHVDNKLAEYIAAQLLSHNLYGFWDYNDIKLADDILEEILEARNKSFCFVQLIEQIVFSVPDGGKKNWLYEEYKSFKRRSQDQPEFQKLPDSLFFIIQDDRALKIANLPPLYYNWYSEIVSKKFLELTYYKVQNCRKIRYDIDKLAARIVEIREETLNCLLN